MVLVPLHDKYFYVTPDSGYLHVDALPAGGSVTATWNITVLLPPQILLQANILEFRGEAINTNNEQVVVIASSRYFKE